MKKQIEQVIDLSLRELLQLSSVQFPQSRIKETGSSTHDIEREFKILGELTYQAFIGKLIPIISAHLLPDLGTKATNIPEKDILSKAVPDVLKALYDLPDKPASALRADQYGDTPLSETLEDGDIEEVKKLIMAKDSPLTDAELLTNIGIAVTDAEIRDKLGIDKKTAANIFNGSHHHLTLLGEDTTDLMKAYNFNIEEFGL